MSSISPRSQPNHHDAASSYSLKPARPAMPEAGAKARGLVAGTVAAPANPVSTPASTSPLSGPLAFYRHPADRNQAATAILAGRTLDVQG